MRGEALLVQGDAGAGIPLRDGSVQCVVTSPPYYGLRDYGCSGQIGLESTVEGYVAALVGVFREVRRVLHGSGSLWLNLGDSYVSAAKDRTVAQVSEKCTLLGARSPKTNMGCRKQMSKEGSGLARKQLMGGPWRVALALQADGWILRQDVIWSKPNAMPESVRDRCTRSHEYLFHLVKRPSYYWDAAAMREEGLTVRASALSWRRESKEAEVPGANNKQHRLERSDKQAGHGRRHAGFNERYNSRRLDGDQPGHGRDMELEAPSRNKRSVWSVNTACFAEAHFATFPEALITPAVLACSRPGDVVLDPFSGAGTTGVVACSYGRRYVGLELSAAYLAMSQARIDVATRQGVLW